MSDKLSEPYWAGAENGELVLQRCDSCGLVRHYPRILCANCYSFHWSPVVAERTGTIHSWTISHHAFDPSVASDLPYTLVTVDITAGVRVLGRFDAASPPEMGQAVTLEFRPSCSGGPVPVFAPTKA